MSPKYVIYSSNMIAIFRFVKKKFIFKHKTVTFNVLLFSISMSNKPYKISGNDLIFISNPSLMPCISILKYFVKFTENHFCHQVSFLTMSQTMASFWCLYC